MPNPLKKVYFNEYNLPMEDTIYLPLASGMLCAYAKQFKRITDNYKFMPYIFRRDTVDKIVAQHINPSVVCFSVSMWNYNLSIEVAKKVKEKYPSCIIVFGGASVPKRAEYPIDHIIYGEGEHKLAEFLAGIPLPQAETLDDYPSPYTTGEFDYLMKDGNNYQAIIETNRGCPYTCAYCFWGIGVGKKMRFFSKEYTAKNAKWIGENWIKYVFCADGNFGMFENDIETAKTFVRTKLTYGYPEKFRVCYGKTTKESIFESAKILHSLDLAKSVTLSIQTFNETALKNINRKNIKISDFEKLQKKYSEHGIPTYSELILGLPGETKESFKQGVENILKFAGNNNLFIYHCTILPNTEMADPEYIKKHGIKTVRVPISEIHCKVKDANIIQEYEDIIIGTNTMTTEDWIECAIYSWCVQLKYSLGYTKEIPNRIKFFFEQVAANITKGINRCQVMPDFGNIYYEPEEAALLFLEGTLSNNKKEFARQRILYGRKGKKNDKKN